MQILRRKQKYLIRNWKWTKSYLIIQWFRLINIWFGGREFKIKLIIIILYPRE